jgi:hypothetical protein
MGPALLGYRRRNLPFRRRAPVGPDTPTSALLKCCDKQQRKEGDEKAGNGAAIW